MMQIKEGGGPHIGDWNTEFTFALDNIHAQATISVFGRSLTFDSADLVDARLASWQFQLSSWVLCSGATRSAGCAVRTRHPAQAGAHRN